MLLINIVSAVLAAVSGFYVFRRMHAFFNRLESRIQARSGATAPPGWNVRPAAKPGGIYQDRGALLTPAESHFYSTLAPVAQRLGFRVHVKVRVGDLLQPRDDLDEATRRRLFAKIAQKHVDFVLVDQQMRPVAAVELNDRSHERPDRKARDLLLGRVFQEAGIPLVGVLTARTYNEQEIARLIRSVL